MDALKNIFSVMDRDNALSFINLFFCCCDVSFTSEVFNPMRSVCALSFRYHMLGMFLLIQLSIVGGDWLRRSVLPALAMSMRSRIRDPSAASSGKKVGASCIASAATLSSAQVLGISKGAFDEFVGKFLMI